MVTSSHDSCSTHDNTEKKMAEEKENIEDAQRIIRANMQEQYLRALESEDVPVCFLAMSFLSSLIDSVTGIWIRGISTL